MKIGYGCCMWQLNGTGNGCPSPISQSDEIRIIQYSHITGVVSERSRLCSDFLMHCMAVSYLGAYAPSLVDRLILPFLVAWLPSLAISNRHWGSDFRGRNWSFCLFHLAYADWGVRYFPAKENCSGFYVVVCFLCSV